MSATTERLVEQINKVEKALTAARAANLDVSSLEEELTYLRKKLGTCAQALNEGTGILKG